MDDREVVIPFARRVSTGRNGIIAFQINPDSIPAVKELIQHQEKEGVPHFFYALRIGPSSSPRTTGDKSQNHHINGHCQQIAYETGQPFEDVKLYAKRYALTLGYPILEDASGEQILDKDGRTQGISEMDCSKKDAAKLIEALHIIAAELDIKLTE